MTLRSAVDSRTLWTVYNLTLVFHTCPHLT